MKMKKLFLSGEDRYLNNLLSHNAFILQYFMKLYFYEGSKELISQKWTKQHWKEELYDLFEPKTKNGKKLFDSLSSGKKARFREVLNPEKNDWVELTRIFVRGKGFYKLIDVNVKDGKTDDFETIVEKASEINFSDRYLFLQEYYFTHEKM